MVSHIKFQVCMSICSLIRSFCKIDRGGGGGGGGWSEFRLGLWCHIPNFRSACESILSLEVFAKMTRGGGRGVNCPFNIDF